MGQDRTGQDRMGRDETGGKDRGKWRSRGQGEMEGGRERGMTLT
jgi:hypothetical protein